MLPAAPLIHVTFSPAGSGLTRKQRSLVIIDIIFLSYTALGALLSSLMMHLTFIDGLYFTIVTNLTIGFGDITPNSPVERGVTCLHAAFGIVILGSAVRLIGETVIESLEIGYRLRVREYRRRRRERQKWVRECARWRDACETRLSAKGVPVWVPAGPHGIEGLPVETGHEHPVVTLSSPRLPVGGNVPPPHVPPLKAGMLLNVAALDGAELEDAARAANVPLAHFLGRPMHLDTSNSRENSNSLGRAIDLGSQGSVGRDSRGTKGKGWLSVPMGSMWWERTYHRLMAAKGTPGGNDDAHLAKMYVNTVKALEVEERRSLYLKVRVFLSFRCYVIS
jgi:potassium channel subfamily K